MIRIQFSSSIKKITLSALITLAIQPLSAAENINQLVEQLGARAHAEREVASKKLWELGDAAIPALKKAAESGDPEVKARALDILLRIGIGLTPNMPENLKQMLLQYIKADQQQKARLILKISQSKKGWPLTRALLFKSMDSQLAKRLTGHISHRSILGLREKGKLIEARAQLMIAAVFTGDQQKIRDFAAFALETEQSKFCLSILKTFTAKATEHAALKTNALHCIAIIHRTLKQYPQACQSSREMYNELQLENDKETQVACRKLVVDLHLLNKDFAYLEKFWKNCSFEIDPSKRLTNILYLQRIQGKKAEYQTTLTTIIKLMDVEENYLQLALVLLINGEKEKAVQLYKKHKDLDSLAQLESSQFNFIEYAAILKKNRGKSDDHAMRYFAFMTRGKKDMKYARKIVGVIDNSQQFSSKIGAAIYLKETGFSTLAKQQLAKLLANEKLDDHNAWRAAYHYTENLYLTRLFNLLRHHHTTGKTSPTVELISLFMLSEDPEAFSGYFDLIKRSYTGFDRLRPHIIRNLSQFCFERQWYNHTLALMQFMPPHQKNIDDTLLESLALIRKKQPVKAAHNILVQEQPITLSIPFYVMAHAYKQSGDHDKYKKAMQQASLYGTTNEEQLFRFATYLKNNGLHEYYLKLLDKLVLYGDSLNYGRIESYQLLSGYYKLNENFGAAEKNFHAYYLRACSSPEQLTPGKAMMMAYELHEYKLRRALGIKNLQEAQEALSECLRIFPQNIELPILLHHSQMPGLQSQFNKILKSQWASLSKNIQQFPHNAQLLNTAAWLGSNCDHELERCRIFAHASIKAQPTAAAYDTQAEVYFRLKRHKEAVFYIEKAIKMDTLEPFYQRRLLFFKKALELQTLQDAE